MNKEFELSAAALFKESKPDADEEMEESQDDLFAPSADEEERLIQKSNQSEDDIF